MSWLDKKVPFQEDACSQITKELSVGEVLEAIKTGVYAKQVNTLRDYLKNGEKEKYNSNKKKLPGVCFCGRFEQRRHRDYLKEYHSLVVIDIDKLDASEIFRIKNAFAEDPYVYSMWDSPSGLGIKGIVPLSFEKTPSIADVGIFHKAAFFKLTQYFLDKHQVHLDTTGSDTTRLCFLSFDSNLYLKKEATAFPVAAVDCVNQKNIRVPSVRVKKEKGARIIQVPKNLNNGRGRNSANNRFRIQSIIKFLTKRKLSITTTNEDWYKVGFAIANTFSYDLGEKYYLRLCRLDGVKHDEAASKERLKLCYLSSTGEIKFNTIVYLAQKHGYFHKKRKGGSSEGGTKNAVSS